MASCSDLTWPWKNTSWIILGCRLVVRQQPGRMRLAFAVSTSHLSLHVSFMLSSYQLAEGMTTSSLLETPEKTLTSTWIMDIPCSICLLSKLHRIGGDKGEMESDVSQINDHPKPWHLTACSTELSTQDTSLNVAARALGSSPDSEGNPGCTSPGLVCFEGTSTGTWAKIVEQRALKEASIPACSTGICGGW